MWEHSAEPLTLSMILVPLVGQVWNPVESNYSYCMYFKREKEAKEKRKEKKVKRAHLVGVQVTCSQPGCL